MRILVTGGAGFIGSRLCIRLASESAHEVIVFDNLHRSRESALDSVRNRIGWKQGDVRDRVALESTMRGADLVFHLAAQSNVLGAMSDPEYSFATNVAGTFNVLEAARACAVSKVIFTSSREVYGQSISLPVPESAPLSPKNMYGASKAAAEMYCRAFDNESLRVITLRLANVYGPGDRDRVIPLFFERAAAGVPLTIFGQEKLLDFVWVEDVIDALMRVATRPIGPSAINIGSGSGTTLEHLAARILAITGSNAPVQHLPARDVEVDRYVADTTLAARELEWRSHPDPLYKLDQLWSRASSMT